MKERIIGELSKELREPQCRLVLMGLLSLAGMFCYASYKRKQLEDRGFYAALQEDGTEVFLKKQSKWES